MHFTVLRIPNLQTPVPTHSKVGSARVCRYYWTKNDVDSTHQINKAPGHVPVENCVFSTRSGLYNSVATSEQPCELE